MAARTKARAKQATAKQKARPRPAAKKRPASGSDMKTKPTAKSVAAFIAAVPNETRRKDAEILLKLMKKVTGEPPVMWGPSIVGFGKYRYRYESGREGEMCMTGFSPRSAASVLYIMPGFKDYGPSLERLGKHRIGGSCLYINRLADVDLTVLEEIVADGYARMRAQYGR
jgi:hypothetical protein